MQPGLPLADIAGFTALTEVHGGERVAEIVGQLHPPAAEAPGQILRQV